MYNAKELSKEKMELILKKLEEDYVISKIDGDYVCEIYTDYDDYVDIKYIADIVKGSCSKEDAYCYLHEHIYSSYERDFSIQDFIGRDLIDELEAEFEVENLGYALSEELYMYIDVENILSHTVIPINIKVKTYEEANHDFTFLADGCYSDTGLNKFTQIYCGKSVDQIMTTPENKRTPFESEVFDEIYNICNGMNVFTILSEIDGADLLRYLEKFAYPEKYKDEKKTKVQIKNSHAGLVDFWSGGGSILNMFIDEVEIPLELVEFEFDGMYEYGIDDIYGGIDRGEPLLKLV